MHTDELVERLVKAAEAAIRNEAANLAHDPNGLHSLMVDISIANGGGVLDVAVHVTRRKVHRADLMRKLQPALVEVS